jgi:ABC-type dipeptide/oligopeptide/nickel transport system permease component
MTDPILDYQRPQAAEKRRTDFGIMSIVSIGLVYPAAMVGPHLSAVIFFLAFVFAIFGVIESRRQSVLSWVGLGICTLTIIAIAVIGFLCRNDP